MRMSHLVAVLTGLLLNGSLLLSAGAQTPLEAGLETGTETHAIDMATTLRLAGAQNLQIALAVARVREAEATYAETFNRFLPFLAPGVTGHYHDGQLQDIIGIVDFVNRQAVTLGASLNLNLNLGDALYERLRARQLVDLANARAEVERRNTVTRAAAAYLELARANDAIQVAEQAVNTAETYADEVSRAVTIGLAPQVEYYRVLTRLEQNRGLLVRTQAHRRIAAARLAQVLHLEPEVDLLPMDDARAPMSLTDPAIPLGQLLTQAQSARPELRVANASIAAAATETEAVRVGPRYPSLNARANFYQLNGGPNHEWSGFGGAQSYNLELSWRFGPGGLFDKRRIGVAEAREASARLERTLTQDVIMTEVVSAHTQRSALREQVSIAERALEAAQSALDMAMARRDFGVAAVLEVLLAEENLTQARFEYLESLTQYNQSEFELQRASGG